MKIYRLFRHFIKSSDGGGFILLACTALSLMLANSFFGPSYIQFWDKHLNLSFGFLQLDLSVQHWINNGLMAVFFLLVGLEIEREVYDGELSTLKAAALPIAAALGGMVVPALVYYAFNRDSVYVQGFGVPMATDIAFALGMLSLLGKRVPASLKIFITALAIIDDLGAILIIAFFYTNDLSLIYLSVSLAIFGLLLLFNRLKIISLWAYLPAGLAMWYCMHHSGVHGTLSGVLLAFAIPFNKNRGPENVSFYMQEILHKPVSYIILPLFALANTAILLNDGWVEQIKQRYSLGILAGLVLGKPLGITAFAWLAVKLGWAYKPTKLSWPLISAGAIFGGIGFTMSIFIANLAFTEAQIIQYAKVAILLASLVATAVGLAAMYVASKKQNLLKPSN